MAWFETRGLDYRYGQGPLVVRGVSFGLERGRLMAVIGANGSGKSTLLRMMAGLLRPLGGEMRLDGRALAAMPARARAREIAYVPQAALPVFPFAALEVVLSGRSPHLGAFGFEGPRDREKALEALEAIGAAHLAARRVTDLSGGERQMVVLARALAQEPRLLLLDEPSAALDLKHRAGLVRALARLRDERGLTAILVTHDLGMVGSTFDRVLAMRCGEVAAEDAPDRVLETALLARIYDEPNVRAGRIDGRAVVWVEA
jgi:iron complex transport system ATP-binding protein